MKEFVAKAIDPTLKKENFRKVGFNYYKRLSKSVQVFNIQKSAGSNSKEKIFYINVAIAFDSICELRGLQILESPKESECEERGLRLRLEKLINTAPARWVVSNSKDTEHDIMRLEGFVQSIAQELAQIDSSVSFLKHKWFHLNRPTKLAVETFYVCGDFDNAISELKSLTEKFSDRKLMNDPHWWIEKINLSKLK